MKIEELLEQEIQAEFNALGAVELGSQTYEAMVDGLVKLTDRAIEIEKLNVEKQQNKLRSDEEKKQRWISNGVAIAGIILPLAVTIWGTRTCLKFEEEGTVTTIVGRSFINKLFPRK